MKSKCVALIALVAATGTASAQATSVRIKVRIPANVEVRAYAPDSARFALGDDEPAARRDTIVLKNGAELSYDRSSGPLAFLVRGLKDGQTVNISGNGERNSKWGAFVTHDVSIDGRGPSLQFFAIAPRVTSTLTERDPK